jgi:hypothetical protein
MTRTAARYTVTAWVNTSNYMILKIQLDLSRWAGQILGEVADLPVTGLVLTESHRVISTSPVPSSQVRFGFDSKSGDHRVSQVKFPRRTSIVGAAQAAILALYPASAEQTRKNALT